MNWDMIICLALCTLGLVEWIKGFCVHIKGAISGNVLRVLQFIMALLLAFVQSSLPDWVITALVVVSVTTLYKTDIASFGSRLFNKKEGKTNGNNNS